MEKLNQEYAKLIKDYINTNYPKHVQKPVEGKIRYPYFTSGIDYVNQVWDWGSWQASVSMHNINDEKVIEAQKGIIFNFLDTMNEEGRMPILFSTVPAPWLSDKTNAFKPCFAQHVLEISNKCHDFTWVKPIFHKVIKLTRYYEKYQYDEESGLFYWLDDVSIGVDNDPSVFYCPNNSSAHILLNCLMYKEMLAIVKIANELGEKDIEKEYREKAEKLCLAIRSECYDPIDGYFYTASIFSKKVDPNHWLHSGHPRFWKTLPVKITTWCGMMALWSGVATPEQAKRCVERYLNKDGLFSNYGIRSLAKNEKMYAEVASGNPSCWLGPIWVNANYFTYVGLKNYGFNDLANDLAVKTINMLGKDLKDNGGFHEYYDSNTGLGVRGLGMHGWNFLVGLMIDDIEKISNNI